MKRKNAYRLCIARTSINPRYASPTRPPAGLTRGYWFPGGRYFVDEFGWSWGGVEATVEILRRSVWVVPPANAPVPWYYSPARWLREAKKIGFNTK